MSFSIQRLLDSVIQKGLITKEEHEKWSKLDESDFLNKIIETINNERLIKLSEDTNARAHSGV